MPINTYILIGSPFTGRLSIAQECIEKSIPAEEKCLLLLAKEDEFKQSDLDSLKKFENLSICVYEDNGQAQNFLSENQNAFAAFYIANANADLADELEFIKALHENRTLSVVRILGFVDCALFSEMPKECEEFYDAVSYFSDCLMLCNRSNVQNSKVEEIKKRYTKMCRPHLVFLVDKNRHCSKTDELLIDEVRRMSFAFDDYDPIDELELDEDTLPEEPFDLVKKQDIYFERLDNSARAKPIENIYKIAEKFNEKI